ncbi:MAG: carboxypeptidase regulatory-like domain-containing protein [Elusimicrobia bacterium]|nr:carboxypeptidase regulatory-like domain-containing protein [Elusimicrobiota bacterium]
MRAALLSLLVALPVRAAVDDSDISGGGKVSKTALSSETVAPRRFALKAAAAPKPEGTALTVSGRFLLTDPKGDSAPGREAVAVLLQGKKEAARVVTGSDGSFKLTAPKAGRYTAVLRLENARWSLVDEDSGKPHEWKAGDVDLSTGGVDLGELRPDPASENGRIPLIHLLYLEALGTFGRLGLDLAWWDRPLTVNYPASSDYYSGWALHLSDARAWDVNLHELGHAVMAKAMNARGGGGAHKIDECYTGGLALSEGWATFFAGVVRLSPDDADAKFEYLVPRRAPIRLENVPEDVCKGENNEWRVAAAFWDLYDSHPDGGDGIALGFPRLWAALKGGSMGSFSDAWRLVRRTLTADEAAAAARAVEHNSLPAALGPTLARPKFD